MKTKEGKNRESAGNAAASSMMVMQEVSPTPEIDVSIIPESIREEYFTPPEIDPDHEEDEELVTDGERDEDEKLSIEKTVADINLMHRRGVDEGKLTIGDLVLGKVFRGDYTSVISRNLSRSSMFNSIAEHPDIEVGGKTLGAWVRAAAVRRELAIQDVNLDNLITSHYVELASVKDGELRKQLAIEADENKYPVKELRTRIKAATKGKTSEVLDGRKAQLEKILRTSQSAPAVDPIEEFAKDPDLILKTYGKKNILPMQEDAKSARRSLRRQEQVLSTFIASLNQIIDKVREGDEEEE